MKQADQQAMAEAHDDHPFEPRPWAKPTTHIYCPDYQAMGDCRVCGHCQNVPWHAFAAKEISDV